MFDSDGAKDLSQSKPPKPAKGPNFIWKGMPVEELVRHRDEITRALPPIALSDMNLEVELLLQFHTIRALQSRVMDDDDVQVNQRAQVANSVAASLDKLVKLQADVYSSERYKLLENLLIRTLRTWPEDKAAEFLTEWRKVLENNE